MNTRKFTVTLLAIVMLTVARSMSANVDGWQLVSSNQVPTLAAFHPMTQEHHSLPGPPLPYNPAPGAPTYTIEGSGLFIVDDRPLWQRTDTLFDARWANFRDTLLLWWLDGQLSLELGGPPALIIPSTPDYGTNLYLVITDITNQSGSTNVYISAVNTAPGAYYQLLSKTNLPDLDWVIEQEFYGAANATQTDLPPVSEVGRRQTFFWAAHSDTTVGVYDDGGGEAFEPDPFTLTGGGSAQLQIQRTGSGSAALTVNYHVSGTASNGVDYSQLNGTFTIPQGQATALLNIDPLADFLVENDETVVITLLIGTNYLLTPGTTSATVIIHDNVPMQVVANVSTPVGIDYHAPSNALVVSGDYLNSGQFSNFVMIHSNGTVNAWSGVHRVPDEIKFATVKATGNGFTNGDVYFGSSNGIGWLSADGTASNLSWCVLTNSTVTNVLPLRGSLYVDRTGIFSNQIIAVTSEAGLSSGAKGVWRVDSQAHPTLLANLNTLHLEGSITLTNDAAKYGQWAGKIVTGDEGLHLIYAIATNGTTTSYALGIDPEDFDIIPPNQHLYVCDQNGGKIWKVSSNFFADRVGDIVITQAGEVADTQASLFIVHWDSLTSNFVTRYITNYFIPHLEHVTFAPADLPSVSQ